MPICRRAPSSPSCRITTRSATAPSASGMSAIAPGPALRAVTALYLLLPQIPMLFMGEEWQSARPFLFFCDFGPELANAVTRRSAPGIRPLCGLSGRVQARAYPGPSGRGHLPRQQARLGTPCGRRTCPYAALVSGSACRAPPTHRATVAATASIRRISQVIDAGALVVRWRGDDHRELTLETNLNSESRSGFPAAPRASAVAGRAYGPRRHARSLVPALPAHRVVRVTPRQ